MTRQTTALIILDGWGHREESESNAILNANTPFWDSIWAKEAHALIETSGAAVGLPEGQMGNSEVGHMNLGAGRIVYQNFTRISKDIEDGTFEQNSALSLAMEKSLQSGRPLHLIGLLSPGGVHSHENHIVAAITMAARKGLKEVYVHAILDGRDTPPRSAKASLELVDGKLKELGIGRITSMVGRYFAMDRDNRWDRVKLAYDLLTSASAEYRHSNTISALDAAYARGENDEFISATSICDSNTSAVSIEDDDVVVFMNFRADRARELTRSFVEKGFSEFEQEKKPVLADFVMLTEYSADIKTTCAYPPSKLINSIGDFLSSEKKTQLRIAETEKYAHVTFFFSGGREAEFDGESRILIPSPDVATYDLKPEMSAPELTDKLVHAIHSNQYDLIVCNYANGDMVGHTGNYEAAIKAAECLNACLEKVATAIRESNAQCLITADHGNAEQMTSPVSGQAHTAHTTLPVPLVYLGEQDIQLKPGGKLSDIAPTLLELMSLDTPKEMTGSSLIER